MRKGDFVVERGGPCGNRELVQGMGEAVEKDKLGIEIAPRRGRLTIDEIGVDREGHLIVATRHNIPILIAGRKERKHNCNEREKEKPTHNGEHI